ncbi:MAG: acyltransferase, partial [Candidatus Eremiobacteraeota bacterium]|nr:acyltransferase [Candidatus Eremiobacteraeota bacterium]
MTLHDGRSRFRADIEGLRGVAVLAVVCYHAGLVGWSGGFIGVDVFFVISGYLITGLLVKELERTGRVNLREFFARRIRRLLPASLVVLGATVAAASLLLSPGERVTVARTARATAAYASNLYFLVNASDYFASANDLNPLLHTWSLAVEEQFYLIWPLLLLAAFRGQHRRRALAGLIAMVSVVSLAACVIYTRRNVSWAFFGTPFRAWEFGAGALVSLVPATLNVSASVRRSFGVLGTVAIAGSVVLFTRATPFPGVAAMLPVAGTTAVLWAGSNPTPRATRWLQIPPLTAIGRLSYSWYLWHWPVLVFGAVIWPEPSAAGRIALAAFSLGLATVSYVAVEQPIRLNRRVSARPRLTIVLAAASSVVWVVGASALRSAALRDAQAPAQRAIADAERIPGVYAAHCINDYGDATIHACSSGDPQGRPTVVLFGDSHAAQWAAALDVEARRRGWRLVLLLKSSC